MKQPSKEKVEQYRREFSELLKDLTPQAIVQLIILFEGMLSSMAEFTQF